MLSQKYGNLHGDDIDDCKHVWESHVGDDKEQGSIDTLHSCKGVLLAKVDNSQD